VTDRWFSSGTLVSSTNKTDCHNITEILLNVVLNTKTLTLEKKLIEMNGKVLKASKGNNF
jgi:hypothetical protein